MNNRVVWIVWVLPSFDCNFQLQSPTLLEVAPTILVTFSFLWPWTITCDLDLQTWPR